MPRKPNSIKHAASAPTTVTPQLGLVCQTYSDLVRFRTITRTRYLSLSKGEKIACLRDLYADNLRRVFKAIGFCQLNDIHLYRLPCGLFPMSDEQPGIDLLHGMSDQFIMVGRLATLIDLRLLMHPDQFVVLSSTRPEVIRTGIEILAKYALAFDLMGLPRSAWSVLLIHGGARGQAKVLRSVVADLPTNIRARLAFENDEHSYGAEEILDICRTTGSPMIFDCHHHVLHERIDTYDHPSVAAMTEAARSTWPDAAWQIVHVSNGIDGIADPRHSDFITQMPEAYRTVPWIEVEAKAKEDAILKLREWWPGKRRR